MGPAGHKNHDTKKETFVCINESESEASCEC